MGSQVSTARYMCELSERTLGHDAVDVDRVNARLLEVLGELHEAGVVVPVAHLSKRRVASANKANVSEGRGTASAHKDEATGPRVDRRDRVGRGLVALLVFAVVPRDGAVRCLRLDDLAIRSLELRRHESERAEALRNNVRLCSRW